MSIKIRNLITVSIYSASLFSSSAFTQSNVSVSPFGKASPQQKQAAQKAQGNTLNAVAQWAKLPASVRNGITSQLAPLSTAERLALLSTVPSLTKLSLEEKQALMVEIAKVAPPPAQLVLDASFSPPKGTLALAPVNPAGDQNFWEAQSFTVEHNGQLARVEIQLSNCFLNTADLLLTIRAGLAPAAPSLAVIRVPTNDIPTPANYSADCENQHQGDYYVGGLLSAPIAVTAGQVYSIWPSSDTNGENINHAPYFIGWWGATGGTVNHDYSGGGVLRHFGGGPTVSAPSYDKGFKTYVLASP